MTDPAAIAADPQWLPHTLDLAGGRMRFVPITRDTLTGAGFLADVPPDHGVWVPLDAVRAMAVEPGALHFIFHTAFCRSTLLARALTIPGVSVGLAEPGILAQLAGAGEAARDLVKPVCDLLARPWVSEDGAREAVFVKPTNHANRLIPALLAARPDAAAVLMTNPLPAFLKAVDKRAIMGRRWGRQLYLELMSYAGMELGMDAREQFSMTDLQAAGLAWFLAQRRFTQLAEGADAARLRVLCGDRFAADKGGTLEAVLNHAGLSFDPTAVAAAANGPIFARHAKLGGDFASESTAESAALHPALEQEIAQVQQWLEMIARQAGIAMSVRHTLT